MFVVLALCREGVEETEILGFVFDQQTFYTEHDQVVQATSGSVRLVSPDNNQMINMRQPPGGKVIIIGGYNQTKVVVAARPVFFYIEIQKGNLALAGDTILEHEVGRIDMTPREEEGDEDRGD